MTKKRQQGLRSRWFSTLFLSNLCWVLPTWATDAPQMAFNSSTAQLAGFVPDGSVVLRGRITFYGPHTGIRLWSSGAFPSEAAGHYVMQGVQNSRHILRVRLNNGAWITEQPGSAMLLNTTEPVVNLTIVVDGDQHIAADRYVIMLNASALDATR